MIEYTIRDNGNIAFIANVCQKEKRISICAHNCTDNVVYTSTYTKLFVGKSRVNLITIDSGNIGEKFDGNTLLVQTDKCKYTYIGGSIFSFTSKSSIIEYESPVGNNEYAYPFACDDKCNYYLMNERVIVNVSEEHREVIRKGYSPYSHYYNIRKISTHEMVIIPKDTKQKVRTHPLRYLTNPEFEYEWVVEEDTLYIREKETKKTVSYTMEEYAEYIRNIGVEKGISVLEHDKDYYVRGHTGVVVRD